VIDNLKRTIPWEELGLEIAGEAGSGLEALKMLRQLDIDIMLTDIQMPEMTGLELIEQSHALGYYPNTIILTAYDYFEYVKTAIHLGVENYLLKPVNSSELTSSLLRTVENVRINRYKRLICDDLNTFRENLLNRWVSGKIQMHELIERAELAGINVNARDYIAVIIKPLVERDDVAAQYSHIIKENIFSSFDGNIFINPYGHIVVLLHDQNMEEKTPVLKIKIQSVIDEAFVRMGIYSYAAIGKPVHGCEKVPDCYNSALLYQTQNFVDSINSVMIFHPDDKSQYSCFMGEDDFDITWDLLLSGNIDRANRVINDIMESVNTHESMSLYSMKNFVMDLIFRMTRELRRVYVDEQSILGDYKLLVESIESISQYDQLQNFLFSITALIISSLKKHEEKQSPLIIRVIDYIQKNIAENHSLKALAIIFNINASYLGTLIKNYTGEAFPDYVNKIKIKKARELLLNTNLKTYEIAEKVGYSSDNYFCKVFKKITGQSPHEYKIANRTLT